MSHPSASESWYKWAAFLYGEQSRAGGSPRHFCFWVSRESSETPRVDPARGFCYKDIGTLE